MNKQQLLEEVLEAVSAAGHAYVELRHRGSRYYDLVAVAVGPEAAQSVQALFGKRRLFKVPFELRIKDVNDKPAKVLKSLYWAGSAT